MNATSRTMRIEVCQAAPEAGNLAANIETVARVVEGSSAELVVFPELFLSGYDTARVAPSSPDSVAMTLADPRLERLTRLCRASDRALIVGFAEDDGGSGVYDSALVIDADGSRSTVRKSHLFGSERDVFLEGDRIAPVSLQGVSVGIMNCFEIEFPEIARTLAKQAARLFVVISANMAPYQADHEIGARARAIENRVPLVYSNRIGAQDGHEFCGLSRVVASDGSPLQQLDEWSTGSLVADIAIGEPPAADVDMLAQLRPTLYR